MIADNFWKILFILIICTGLVFWWKSYREDSAFKHNASELADHIAFSETTRAKTNEDAHVRFIKAIALLNDAEAEGTNLTKLLNAAFAYNEISHESAEAGLVSEGLFEALGTGKALGIFNDTAIWELREGKHVTIAQGPYQDEKISVALHVPASIGPGAELFLGNFVLVPESVAAVAKDLEITEDVLHTSSKLANADVITPGRYASIKDAYYSQQDANKN